MNCVIIIVTESGIAASKIVLPKRRSMTKRGIQEYMEAVRERHFLAPKKAKGRVLDKFTRVTGCPETVSPIYGRGDRI